MTFLGNLGAFALGVYLSIRMIAALYQILDLWYAIRTHYPRVICGVVGWATTIAAAAWLLGPPARVAFVWGLVGFLVFYLSLFQLRHLLIAALKGPVNPALTRENRLPTKPVKA